MKINVRKTCIYCSKKFETTAVRRLFCGDVCRHRYSRELSSFCFYCGATANTKDHVAPQSTFRGFVRHETVPCCKECNSTLQDAFPNDVHERIKYLAREFERRKGLGRPLVRWDEDELSEMSPEMAKHILAKQNEREMNEQRHAHMLWRAVDVLDVDDDDAA